MPNTEKGVGPRPLYHKQDAYSPETTLPEVRADTKTGRPYPSAADGGTTRLYDDAIKTMTSRSEALVKKYTDVPPQQRKQISASASGERMSTRESTSRDAKHKCRVDKCMESSTKVGCFRCTWEDEMEIVERLHTRPLKLTPWGKKNIELRDPASHGYTVCWAGAIVALVVCLSSRFTRMALHRQVAERNDEHRCQIAAHDDPYVIRPDTERCPKCHRYRYHGP